MSNSLDNGPQFDDDDKSRPECNICFGGETERNAKDEFSFIRRSSPTYVTFDRYCSALCALQSNNSAPINPEHLELLSSRRDVPATPNECFVCRIPKPVASEETKFKFKLNPGMVPYNYPDVWICGLACKDSLVKYSIAEQFVPGSKQMAECKGLIGTFVPHSDKQCTCKCRNDLCTTGINGSVRFSTGCECRTFASVEEQEEAEDDFDYMNRNCQCYCGASCMADALEIGGGGETYQQLDLDLLKRLINDPEYKPTSIRRNQGKEASCCICKKRYRVKDQMEILGSSCHRGQSLLVCDDRCATSLAIKSAGMDALKMYVALYECEKLNVG